MLQSTFLWRISKGSLGKMKIKTFLVVFSLVFLSINCDMTCEKKRKKLEKIMRQRELDTVQRKENDLLNTNNNKYHQFSDEDQKIKFDNTLEVGQRLSDSESASCPKHVVILPRY